MPSETTMKIYSLITGDVLGEREVPEFFLKDTVREDVLNRVVVWQRSRFQRGCHKTLTRGEVSGRKGKPFKQKGTGRARQGSLRGPHQRGGGHAFAKSVRSHAIECPKKIRQQALRMAVIDRWNSDRLMLGVWDEGQSIRKTKDFLNCWHKTEKSWSSTLFVQDSYKDLRKVLGNVARFHALPVIGGNVYDILKHEGLVISPAFIDYLEGKSSCK